MLQMRQPVHHDLNGYRDLLLDFFSCAPRPLRDDLDVIVGYVRVGFDRQIVKRDRAPNQQQDRRRQDQESVIERVVNESANHLDGLFMA